MANSKVTQDVLNDFSATLDAKPNLTKDELLQKFPEFGNDDNLLQSAVDYHATSKSGKYKTLEELNSKFPEFGFSPKQPTSSQGAESGFQGNALLVKPSGLSDFTGKPISTPTSPSASTSSVGVKKIKADQIRTLKSFAFNKEQAIKNAEIVKPIEAEPSSALDDLYNSLKAGSAKLGSMIAKTPALIYDIAAIPQNLVAKYTGADVGVNAKEFAKKFNLPENEVAKYYDEAYKQAKVNIDAKYDKPITDYIANGEYSKAIKSIANQVLESTPVSIALITGNAAGITPLTSTLAGGVVFGADKKAELDANNPNMDEATKTMISVGNGLMEGVFENKFGVTKLGTIAKNVLEKEGVDAAQKVAEKSFKEVYAPIFKKYVGIGFEDPLGEAATQFSQNVISKYSGENPELNLMDGVPDAAIVSLGSSVAFSTPVAALDLIKTKESRIKAKDLQVKKDAVESDLANPAIPNDVKDILSEQAKDINAQLADIHLEDNKATEHLDDDTKVEIQQNNKVLDNLETALSDNAISEESKKILEQKKVDLETRNENLLSESKPIKYTSSTSDRYGYVNENGVKRDLTKDEFENYESKANMEQPMEAAPTEESKGVGENTQAFTTDEKGKSEPIELSVEPSTPSEESKVKEVDAKIEKIERERQEKLSNQIVDATNIRNANTKEELDKSLMKAFQEDTIQKALNTAGMMLGKDISSKYYNKDYSFKNEVADAIEDTQKSQINKINAKYDAELDELKSSEEKNKTSEKTENKEAVVPSKEGAMGEDTSEGEQPQAEVVEPTEGSKVEIEPLIKNGMPRKMVYDKGEWKQEVGGDLISVAKKVQEEADSKFKQLNTKDQKLNKVKSELKSNELKVSDENENYIRPVMNEETKTNTNTGIEILPSERANEAESNLVIVQSKKYYTLWLKIPRKNNNGVQYTYLTTLSTNLDEARVKANDYIQKLKDGQKLSVAFNGKNMADIGDRKSIALSENVMMEKDLDKRNVFVKSVDTLPLGLDTKLGFGKYANSTIGEIIENDSSYASWLSENAQRQDIRNLIKSHPTFQQIEDIRELEKERIKAFEEREKRREEGENVPIVTLVRGEGNKIVEKNEDTAPVVKSVEKKEKRVVKDQIKDIIPPNIKANDNVRDELKPKMFQSQIDGANTAIQSMNDNGVVLNGDGAGVGKTRQIIAVADHFAKKGKVVVIISENAAIGKPFEKVGAYKLGGSMEKDSQEMGVKINLLEGGVKEGNIYISTYNRIKDSDIPKGAIVIFDESQNLANTFGRSPDANNKEEKQWEAKFKSILNKAEATAYYSATPADKPHQLSYLHKILGFETPEAFLAAAVENGTQIKTRKFGREEIKYYDVPSSAIKRKKLYDWVNGLMVKAGQEGIFIKREISYEGTDVQFHDVKGTNESVNEFAGLFNDVIQQMSLAQKNDYKLLAPNSYILYAAELAKIGEAVKMAKREKAAGRKVIIFVSRIKEMEIRGKRRQMDGTWGDPVVVGKIPSPVEILRKELEKDGITFVELHGSSKMSSQKAQKEFNEKADALVASLESGGTGINLDDTKGDSPRTEIFMFSPYRGISTIQGMGRIWRASTIQNDNKPNRYVFITTSDISPDIARSGVLAKKLQLMNAAIGGTAVSKLPMSKANYDVKQLVGIELPDEGEESAINKDKTGILKPVEIEFKKSAKGNLFAEANADLLEWYERGGVERTGLNIKIFKGDNGKWIALSDKQYTPEEYAPEGINEGVSELETEQLNTKENAVQESKAESVLPREQGEVREARGEREGVGQGKQGQEPTKASEEEVEPAIKVGEHEGVDINKVSAKDFHNSLQEASKDNPNAHFLNTSSTLEDYEEISKDGGKFVLSKNGDFGGLKISNGYITGIFKNPSSKSKNAAKSILKILTNDGDGFLDAYDNPKLNKVYIDNGFTIVAKVPFNKAFKPKGAKDGFSSDILIYVYDPNGKLSKNKIEVFEDYEEGLSFAEKLNNINNNNEKRTREARGSKETNAENVASNASDKAKSRNARGLRGRSRYYDALPESEKRQLEKSAKDYIVKNRSKYNLPEDAETVVEINKAISKEIYDLFESMPNDDSSNPEVVRAYFKLANEVEEQYKYLTDELGIKVEFVEDDPYANSAEMIADVVNNKSLKVFKGGQDHQLLGKNTIDSNGITANEKFRAVHDYFGHAVEGNQFGAEGEEKAWVAHSKMFSKEAQRALTTETRGQNSWVNNSPENKLVKKQFLEAAKLISEGRIEEGQKLREEAQKNFKFAEQKVALLPEKYSNWDYYKTKKQSTSESFQAETKVESAPEKVQKEAKIEKEYKEAISKKSERAKNIAKENFINDNFDKIVSQMMLNNKIKRKC